MNQHVVVKIWHAVLMSQPFTCESWNSFSAILLSPFSLPGPVNSTCLLTTVYLMTSNSFYYLEKKLNFFFKQFLCSFQRTYSVLHTIIINLLLNTFVAASVILIINYHQFECLLLQTTIFRDSWTRARQESTAIRPCMLVGSLLVRIDKWFH